MFDSRIIAQGLLGASIAFASVMGGNALIEMKKLDQTVSVKGLSERIVKANEGSWVIEFQVTDNDIKALNKKFIEARKKIEDFVLTQGFETNKIQRPPVSISQLSKYENATGGYKASGTIQVSSSDVDKAAKAAESTDALLGMGVFMTRTSVNYYFTALNDIKPAMLEEAAKNAKDAADRFAASSGTKVGLIKNADQGPFSITAPFSEWGSETSSIMKRVRVVTNVSFFLEK